MGSLKYHHLHGENFTVYSKKVQEPLCRVYYNPKGKISPKVLWPLLPRPSYPKPPARSMVYVGGYGFIKSTDPSLIALHYREAYVVDATSDEPNVLRLAADLKDTPLVLDDSHLGSPVWTPLISKVIGIVIKSSGGFARFELFTKHVDWFYS